MSRILVLYVSAGTGHVSAAKAVGEALALQPGVEVLVDDLFNHINETTKEAIVSSYNEISTNAQGLYTMFHSQLYKDSTESALRMNKTYATMARPFLQRFEKFVTDFKPDVLVYTMQYPLHLLEKYAAERNIPEYAIITDFSVQTTWLRQNVTGYFVASTLTKNVLQRRGIAPENIYESGIPVKLEIAKAKEPMAMRQAHDFDTDKPLVTVFGGGVATDRIRNMVRQLLESDLNGTVAVVAGRNKELVAGLKDLKAGPGMEFRLLDFITYVDDLVVASDLVITKPGGLMTSEVLARATPMIVIDPIPGQEEWNADFVNGSGSGLHIRMPELVPAVVTALFNQPERLKAMRQQGQIVGRPRAAQSVAEQLVKNIEAGVGRLNNQIRY
jgi:processive 1,2-diacylglycerol beta-glucosyltransferase